MLCSPRCSRSPSAASSGSLNTRRKGSITAARGPWAPGRAGARMSTTSTAGSFASATRSGSVSSVYFPACAFCQLSRLGVAVPSTTIAPSPRARTSATSRA